MLPYVSPITKFKFWPVDGVSGKNRGCNEGNVDWRVGIGGWRLATFPLQAWRGELVPLLFPAFRGGRFVPIWATVEFGWLVWKRLVGYISSPVETLPRLSAYLSLSSPPSGGLCSFYSTVFCVYQLGCCFCCHTKRRVFFGGNCASWW